MSGLLAWFLSALLWSSLAMLLVLAIRRPFAAWFGAGPAYALWLLPAAKMLPLPALDLGLAPLVSSPIVILVAEDAAAPMPSSGGPGQWVSILLALWAVGAAVFIARQIWTYARFLGALDHDARPLGRHRGFALAESGAIDGPVAIGILRRLIVVPADFETRYTPAERALALDHEAVHHRRLDLWWNHLALAMLAVHWFNPLAWIAFRAFRADQELACDAAVAAGADPETRHAYASALVKSASRPGLIAACPLNHVDQLKRRLKMMKSHRTGRARLIGGAAAVVLLAGASLAVGGGSAIAQPKQETPSAADKPSEERVKILHLRHDGSETAEKGEPKIRRFEMIDKRGPDAAGKDGKRPLHMFGMADEDCTPSERTELDQTNGQDRTRIILCSKGDKSPAERAAGLQRARDRLAKETEMKPEHRDHVLAALDKEIARLRAQ